MAGKNSSNTDAAGVADNLNDGNTAIDLQSQPSPSMDPTVGSVVRILTILNGAQAARFGIVLGVTPRLASQNRLGQNEEPMLTVCYLGDDQRNLHNANWIDAMERVASVEHWSSETAKAGSAGTFWCDVLPPADNPINMPALALDSASIDKQRAALNQRDTAQGGTRGPISKARQKELAQEENAA